MRMRNTCLMCAPVPPSPPLLVPPDPDWLPELEALEPLPDPELDPAPDPDVELPLVDEAPEVLPFALDPPSVADGEPPLDPQPLKTPSARTRRASAIGTRSRAFMVPTLRGSRGRCRSLERVAREDGAAPSRARDRERVSGRNVGPRDPRKTSLDSGTLTSQYW
jgi:hypothetical protein